MQEKQDKKKLDADEREEIRHVDSDEGMGVGTERSSWQRDTLPIRETHSFLPDAFPKKSRHEAEELHSILKSRDDARLAVFLQRHPEYRSVLQRLLAEEK